MSWRPKFSIRFQLLALFGLLLLTGVSVLALDEYGQYRQRQALEALKNESLAGLRRIKAVSDAYGLDVVDTTFRVRNGLMSWEQGVNVIDTARLRIDRHWGELERMAWSPEEQALFAQVRAARGAADLAVAELRAILVAQDLESLGRFADIALYPSIDPVTARLKRLTDLELIDAERIVRTSAARARRDSVLRVGLSLLTLAVVAVVGRSILRNVYRGVEALTGLAQRMRRHDYTAEPRYRPRGELGEVLDAVLGMRADVLAFETELTEQLARNETVRAELAERDLFQRSLLAAAQVAIVAVTPDGRISHVNPFAERLLGYRAEELLGQAAPAPGPIERQAGGVPRLIDGAELAAAARELTAALDREVSADWHVLYQLAELGRPPREWTLVRRDGRRVPVLLALSPMRNELGELAGLLVVGTDLTELKKLEQELRDSELSAREANQAKSTFLAAMSHEIRTPMIGVVGMLEVLAHSDLDAEQRQSLNIIQQSAQSLLQIIGDILDFSKIEAGRLDLAPATVDLPRLVRATAAHFVGSASSKGLSLVCTIDERVGPAHVADPLRLRQILSNFLSNAIKFTERGLVEVALEWQGGGLDADRLCFRVTDTGIGISAEQQARLFRPFSQAEGSTTRRYGGTGLGLVICRRLAELMGGEIAMESAPGTGTTLRLRVRLRRGDPAALEDTAEPERPGLLPVPRRLPDVAEAEREGSLILLVDDHPTNRLVIARQLALAGYASEAAEDGLVGFERWRSGRYALVLTDVHMPRMDGYELARAVREEETQTRRRRTPVIALTAAALKGEAERCLAAGMDDYLAKPVSIPQLVACVQRWLPHTRPAPEAAARSTAEAAPLPQLQQPSPLDPAVLAELTGDDPAEAALVLRDFLAATRADLVAVERARRAGDAAAVAHEAHKIKGAACMIGAGELAAAAAELEAAGNAADWTQLLPRLADLATAAERLRLHVAERWPAAAAPS